MTFLIKNTIFDNKEAPAASRQPREILFSYRNDICGKKRRLRQAAGRGKWQKTAKSNETVIRRTFRDVSYTKMHSF